MPGEISRSSKGPRKDAPLVPPWICDLRPDHQISIDGTTCKWCRMPKDQWAAPKSEPVPPGQEQANDSAHTGGY